MVVDTNIKIHIGGCFKFMFNEYMHHRGIMKLQTCTYKAFRHIENLFIQGFVFIHPRFVFIVQPISEPVQ